MRTTITLDRDVAEKIKQQIKKTGKSAKQIYNSLLRTALSRKRTSSSKQSIQLKIFQGKTGLMPGYSWDMTQAQILDKLDESDWKER